jgi:hypothetical protein
VVAAGEIAQAMSVHPANQTLPKMLSPMPRREENHRERENSNSDSDADECLAHFLVLLGKVVPMTTCPDERPTGGAIRIRKWAAFIDDHCNACGRPEASSKAADTL